VNSVTWTQLLANKEVQRHKTSKKELGKLRVVIALDLADASLNGVSTGRRFATAYNAALQAAKMAIACASYRVVGAGHHRISFEVVKLDLFPVCQLERKLCFHDELLLRKEVALQAGNAFVFETSAHQPQDLWRSWGEY
jgi:hypothetical protein